MDGAYRGITVENNCAYNSPLCVFSFCNGGRVPSLPLREKIDRIVAAVFSLSFALLCLVGIIISKLNKPDSCENYDKANSIYSEMQRLKEEQFAAPYKPAETTEE